MANQKEVQSGEKKATDGTVCSVSGKCCRCGDSGRCESRLGESRLDPIPVETVRQLATLKLHLGICKDDCDLLAGFSDFYRVWPQPEIRDIRRKITTAQAMIDELVGARR